MESVDNAPRGTSVVLHLKEDEQEFLQPWQLRSLIARYSDHIGFPIRMAAEKDDDKDAAATHDAWQVVNQASALWTRAKGDLTIKTALLEARYLWGEQELFDKFRKRFQKECLAGQGEAFYQAKLNERKVRHERFGPSRYALEPNIKEGKGGLRDLQTLRWIGRFLYNAETRN